MHNDQNNMHELPYDYMEPDQMFQRNKRKPGLWLGLHFSVDIESNILG